jgi:hypothetical protein
MAVNDKKYRTVECKTFNKFQCCPFGAGCKFKHGINKPEDYAADAWNFFWRTQLCNKAMAGEQCTDEKCNYAHNDGELNEGCHQPQHGPQGFKLPASTIEKLEKLKTMTPKKEEKPIEAPAAPKKPTFASVAAAGASPVVKKLVFESTNGRLERVIKESGMTPEDIADILEGIMADKEKNAPATKAVVFSSDNESTEWGDLCS